MNFDAFPFFQTLNHEEQTYLKKSARPLNIEAGTILFYCGDHVDHLLLLASGEVRLYLHGNETDEITLYYLKATEQCIINTSSTISATPAVGTAVATSHVKGWLLPREAVLTLMQRSPSYQNFIFSLFTLRLASLAKLIEEIRFGRLHQRLLKWIAAQHKPTITITHEALAQELGSSRVVISRLLKQIEIEGKVRLGRGKIERL